MTERTPADARDQFAREARVMAESTLPRRASRTNAPALILLARDALLAAHGPDDRFWIDEEESVWTHVRAWAATKPVIPATRIIAACLLDTRGARTVMRGAWLTGEALTKVGLGAPGVVVRIEMIDPLGWNAHATIRVVQGDAVSYWLVRFSTDV